MSEFEGQVVIVTGSAGAGVGQATARRFAAEGAEVVVSDLSEKRVLGVAESLAEERGREYLAIPCDVSDQESVAELIGKTIERYGRIDHLINNAYRDMETPFLEMDDVTWHTPITVCLHGTYYCTKAAVPHMIEAGGGKHRQLRLGGDVARRSGPCAVRGGEGGDHRLHARDRPRTGRAQHPRERRRAQLRLERVDGPHDGHGPRGPRRAPAQPLGDAERAGERRALPLQQGVRSTSPAR